MTYHRGGRGDVVGGSSPRPWYCRGTSLRQVHCTAVQCSAVQSRAQYSAVQDAGCRTVQCSTGQSAVQCDAGCSTVQCSTVQGAVQCGAGCSTVEWLLSLPSLLCSHGYIFPIDDHILVVRNDSTSLYRFQVWRRLIRSLFFTSSRPTPELLAGSVEAKIKIPSIEFT